ncbi:unnamed protein product [Vicia faba]|uniref:Uncharacterized protein n=1 Tax=Vicia faba TaxID=3906 RepID=A0AAV0YJY6_VICFA|nr:unnamed protein product [Vicia faba]
MLLPSMLLRPLELHISRKYHVAIFQLRNKIIGHSLKNLSNEEINMKKWWLRYKPDMGTLHLWKCYYVRLQCLDPECRISRLRRVSLVIGGLLWDLHVIQFLSFGCLQFCFGGIDRGKLAVGHLYSAAL